MTILWIYGESPYKIDSKRIDSKRIDIKHVPEIVFFRNESEVLNDSIGLL